MSQMVKINALFDRKKQRIIVMNEREFIEPVRSQ
jgi:hypothetical protein